MSGGGHRGQTSPCFRSLRCWGREESRRPWASPSSSLPVPALGGQTKRGSASCLVELRRPRISAVYHTHCRILTWVREVRLLVPILWIRKRMKGLVPGSLADPRPEPRALASQALLSLGQRVIPWGWAPRIRTLPSKQDGLEVSVRTDISAPES